MSFTSCDSLVYGRYSAKLSDLTVHVLKRMLHEMNTAEMFASGFVVAQFSIIKQLKM